MKINILKLIAILCLCSFFACKKETIAPFAHIVGDWEGKETYKSFLGDSSITTIIVNFNLSFSPNGTGFLVANGSKDSLVWSYNEAQKEVDVRIKIYEPPVVSFTTYPFSILEDKSTLQKWSYYQSYLSTGNKVRKFITQWDLTKK